MFKIYVGHSPKCRADTLIPQITLIKLETDAIQFQGIYIWNFIIDTGRALNFIFHWPFGLVKIDFSQFSLARK